MFVVTQTVRHRDFFLPVSESGKVLPKDHAARPTDRRALTSLGMLAASLVAVGVVIALLVLLPESIAALNAARRDHTQVRSASTWATARRWPASG